MPGGRRRRAAAARRAGDALLRCTRSPLPLLPAWWPRIFSAPSGCSAQICPCRALNFGSCPLALLEVAEHHVHDVFTISTLLSVGRSWRRAWDRRNSGQISLFLLRRMLFICKIPRVSTHYVPKVSVLTPAVLTPTGSVLTPELTACGRALARARQACAAQLRWQHPAQQATCSAITSRMHHGGFACRICQRVGTEMRSQCVPVSTRQARG